MSGVKTRRAGGLRDAWRVVWETLRNFLEIDGEQRAASFAYYALFALFPLFALFLTVGSAILGSQSVIHAAEPLGIPQQALVWKMAEALEQSRGSVSVVSFIILLWSSMQFFHALVRGVNRAWHTIEIPWWQLPLKNLMMMLVLASALLIGLITPALMQAARNLLMAFGAVFENYLKAELPGPEAINMVFNWGRYALGSAVLFYAFAMLYMLAPRRRVRFRQVWLASLLVSVTLQLCQNAFVNYLPRFVNYNAIYGTVGVMMLLLLWVYLSGVVIILGACFCAAQAKLSGDDEVTPSS